MADFPDLPGPGEDVAPNGIEAEAHTGPIPDGELPGHALRDPRRLSQELRPVDQRALGEGPEAGTHQPRRRTSTDREAPEQVTVDGAIEDRLDHSAEDDHREEVFDPAQDDAGPCDSQRRTGHGNL